MNFEKLYARLEDPSWDDLALVREIVFGLEMRYAVQTTRRAVAGVYNRRDTFWDLMFEAAPKLVYPRRPLKLHGDRA